MSDNNPVDPTGENSRKQAPLSNPAVSPNPSTRESSSQAGTTKAGASAANSQSSEQQEKESLRQDLNETGEKVKHEARSAARDFTDSARASAESQVERQQQAAAGELGNIARALRKTAEEVKGESNYLPIDRLARQAADKLDDLSESLRGTDVRTVLNRLESYTRDQPGVVLGGAIISGFLLARFLRSSGENERTSEYGDQSFH